MITKKELEALYEKYTQEEIADLLNVHERTVRRWFTKYDIKTGKHTNPQFIKSGKKKLPKKKKVKEYTNKEDFLKVYQEVKSLPLVAKHYGISPNTALMWKKRHNISTILGVSEEGLNKLHELKPYTDEKWLREYYDMYSMPEIAELCGVHRDTIRDWIKRFNIQPKSVKEQRERKANFGNRFIYEQGFDKKHYIDVYEKQGRITNKMKKFIIDTVGECQCCGFNKVLELHHIDENHNNNKAENHLVVCPNCHAMIHRLGRTVEELCPNYESWINKVKSYQGGH